MINGDLTNDKSIGLKLSIPKIFFKDTISYGTILLVFTEWLWLSIRAFLSKDIFERI